MTKFFGSLVAGAFLLFAAPTPASAQKLTSVQPTNVCDPSTLTNCAPVSPTNGLAVDVKTISAAPTGQQTAANSDSVVLCTGCSVPVQYSSTTTTMQSAATGNGNGTVLAVDGLGAAVLTLNCSGCGGGTTINFEGQNDGTNFFSINGVRSGTTTQSSSTTIVGLSMWRLQVAGLKQIRARISNYSSGTVTVTGTALVGDYTPTVASIPANSVKYYISVGASEDESQVTASPGVLIGISARNSNATTNAYLKCTNATAASTTPGSTAIFYEMLIPAGSGFVDNAINAPFDTALTCYIVTGKTASDPTEVAADDVSYFLRYRNN
jgi:hypothetical protein